jgi:hypothetical protein
VLHPLFSNSLASPLSLPNLSPSLLQPVFPSRPLRSPLPQTTSVIPRQRLSRRLLPSLHPPCVSPNLAALLPFSDPGCLTNAPVIASEISPSALLRDLSGRLYRLTQWILLSFDMSANLPSWKRLNISTFRPSECSNRCKCYPRRGISSSRPLHETTHARAPRIQLRRPPSVWLA